MRCGQVGGAQHGRALIHNLRHWWCRLLGRSSRSPSSPRRQHWSGSRRPRPAGRRRRPRPMPACHLRKQTGLRHRRAGRAHERGNRLRRHHRRQQDQNWPRLVLRFGLLMFSGAERASGKQQVAYRRRSRLMKGIGRPFCGCVGGSESTRGATGKEYRERLRDGGAVRLGRV